MKVYIVGSMRNPEIIGIGNRLRQAGFEAFDQWISPGDKADDNWQEYCKSRGWTYREALADYHAKHVFEFDKFHLDSSDVGVLVMPAGKSAHLELGYLRGCGKPAYILMDGEPPRYDVMTLLATKVIFSEAELLEELKKL
jgi:hypothetical protein